MSSSDKSPPPKQHEIPHSPAELHAAVAAEYPPLTLTDVLRLAVVAIVAIGFLSVLAMTVAVNWAGRGAAAELARDPKVIVPAQILGYLVVIGFMAALLHSRGLPFWRGIHWHWPSLRGARYAAAGAAMSLVVLAASRYLPVPSSVPMQEYFRDRLGAWLMTIFGITLAPLMEELFFRGFLYPALRRRIGLRQALAATALLFALLHARQYAYSWALLLLLFLVGLALTWIRERTGSVAASFLFHAGYNAMLFGLLYFGTGGFRHLERMQ